jgi:GAF domain-containing protein/HAMP domain-containing protein
MSEQNDSITTVDARQKRIGLWATGAFAILSGFFMAVSLFSVFVVQHGEFQIEDRALMPATIVIFGISLLCYSLVRQGRYRAGSELLFFSMMVLPIIAIVLINNFQWIVASYLTVFPPAVIIWVLPKESRRRAITIVILAILVMTGVEVWNPDFRGTSIFAIKIIPWAIGLTVLILIGFIVYLIWGNPNYPISTRLTILVLVINIPMLIGISSYLSRSAGAEIETQSKNLLAETNHTISTNVNIWLELHYRTLKELVLLPDIVSMNPARQRPILKVVTTTHPNLFLAQTLDLTGLNVARSDDADPIDYSDRQYFQEAKAGAPIASQVLISRTTGKPALNISAPILNGQGRVIGVASIVSQLDEISQDVVEIADTYGITFIVDGSNRVVAHPDPAYTETELKDLSAYPPVAALRNGQTGFINFQDENGIKWIAYISILDNGWGIVSQQRQTELLAPVRRFQGASIALIILGSLIMVVLAWYTIRRTLRPINALTETASAIAAGDLDRQADVTVMDEIGVLAFTFNEMTAKLRESLATMESRVAERTRNLELAAEVGRSVSQVRALDIMLKDAAETIRARFDLYYTQVYLADPIHNELVLQAGTGTVGAELLERGHRLPINTNSINGRAATEKRTVVIADTASSPTFRPNPLLPDTRSEMAVPLLVGEKVVGVLDMQSTQSGALNEETLPSFEALAGQLAVAINNASLLAQTERARTEVEDLVRRLSRSGWEDYLNAINKPEQIGFVYENDEVLPLEQAETVEQAVGENTITVPIAVGGESLGSLVVEVDEQKKNPLTDELLNVVARQVSQQIENLRLLDSAERYRFDAEQATRRLTREGWKEYLQSRQEQTLSFVYDLKTVKPASKEIAGEAAVSLPIKVQNEVVGKLAIQDIDPKDADAIALVNDVATRLSAHIESLRQFDQTQSALSQSEKLFEASRTLTQSVDLQELTASAVKTIDIPKINRAIMVTFAYDSENNIESMDIIANWWSGTGHEATAVGTHYSLDTIRILPMWVSPTPVFFGDTFTDKRIDATTLELFERLNIRAIAVLPLHVGTHQIGALILEADETHNFTTDETRLFIALAPQISTMLENRRQYERAQKQAERESTLNVISQKIQSATTVEAVLQIAARELGHALGAPMTIAQLSMKDKK